MKSRKKRTPHTTEFKENAVRLALDNSTSVAATARNLGINVSTLHTWINKYQDDISGIKPPEDVYEQLKRLQKENKRIREERDILKKATAYFAANQK